MLDQRAGLYKQKVSERMYIEVWSHLFNHLDLWNRLFLNRQTAQTACYCTKQRLLTLNLGTLRGSCRYFRGTCSYFRGLRSLYNVGKSLCIRSSFLKKSDFQWIVAQSVFYNFWKIGYMTWYKQKNLFSHG